MGASAAATRTGPVAWLPDLSIFRDHPVLFRLWLAGLLSQTGTHISRMAMILWLAERHGVTPVGILILCETVPGSIAALASGAVVDRFDKRWILIASDLIRMVSLLIAGLWPSPNLLYSIMCIYSASTAFFQPAKSAATPLVVPAELLPRAGSLDQAASTAVLITGPYAGALILHWLGLQAALGIDALTYLLSAIVLWPVRIPKVAVDHASSMLAGIRQGWTYMWRHPVALEAAVLVELSVLCVGMWTPLAPAFVTGFLHAGDTLIGLQMGLFGLGGLLGAPLAPAAIARWGNFPLLVSLLIAEAFLMLAYTLIPSPIVSCALIVLWGAIVTVMLVSYSTLLQQTVDEAYLGRVFAVSRQLESLGTVIAVGAALALQGVLSAQRTLLLAALFYVAISVSYRLSPRGVQQTA